MKILGPNILSFMYVLLVSTACSRGYKQLKEISNAEHMEHVQYVDESAQQTEISFTSSI